MEILNGNIYWCDIPKYSDTVLCKRRPCIVVSNDIQNQKSKTVNVVPITTNFKRPELPCHVIVKMINNDGMAKAEQILTIERESVREHVKQLDWREKREVKCALLTQIGLI